MVKNWGLQSLEEELDAYGIIDTHATGEDNPEDTILYP